MRSSTLRRWVWSLDALSTTLMRHMRCAFPLQQMLCAPYLRFSLNSLPFLLSPFIPAPLFPASTLCSATPLLGIASLCTKRYLAQQPFVHPRIRKRCAVQISCRTPLYSPTCMHAGGQPFPDALFQFPFSFSLPSLFSLFLSTPISPLDNGTSSSWVDFTVCICPHPLRRSKHLARLLEG